MVWQTFEAMGLGGSGGARDASGAGDLREVSLEDDDNKGNNKEDASAAAVREKESSDNGTKVRIQDEKMDWMRYTWTFQDLKRYNYDARNIGVLCRVRSPVRIVLYAGRL